MSDVGRRADERERGFELVEEQIRRGGSISPPPVVNRPDLIVRLWSGPNVQIHPLRRSSSTMAEAERSSPACADVQDLESVSCRA